MNVYMTLEFWQQFIFSIIRLSTPLIFAAMAAVISNKAGILNMALESMMLTSALVGVVASAYTSNPWLGLLFAFLGGILMAVIISYFVLIIKADLNLTCIAVNLMASGGTVFAMYLIAGNKATTAIALKSFNLPNISIPIIKDIPIIGPILSGHHILTYVAFLSVFVVTFVLYRTVIGLRIRAVGENPESASSVGVNVTKVRFLSFVISGIICTFAGVYMSMGYVQWFSKDMIAGRGYIGLSAMNIADGNPLGSFFAAFVFGAADALANALQMTSFPVEFILMIPYAATAILLTVKSIINEAKRKKALELSE